MNTKVLDDSIKDYFRLLRASKIEKSVKQKNRYDAVLLHMEGYPQKEISQILHIPHRTVSYHIASYKKGGMEDLVIKSSLVRRKTFRCTGSRAYLCHFHPDSRGSWHRCFC